MFAVVEFTGESSVAVVPTIWINGHQCYWPTEKGKAKSMAKKQKVPEENWEQYEIRILYTYETYSEARDNLDRARFESGQSDAEHGNGREESAEQVNADSRPGQLSLIQSQSERAEVETAVTGTGGLDESDQGSGNQVLLNVIDPAALTKELEDIKSQLKVALDMLTLISNKLDKLEEERRPHEANDQLEEMLDFNLPKTTVEQMTAFDAEIGSDMAAKRELIKQLTRKGGKSGLDALKSMTSSLMVDDLAVQYSLQGARKKIGFDTLKNICNVLQCALMKNPMTKGSTTEAQFREDMQHVFKCVADRVTQRLKMAQLRQLQPPSS